MQQILKRFRNWLLRKIVYRKYIIGKGFRGGRGIQLWAKSKITIGNNFYMGRYSQIECDAIIGDNVIFGNCVSLVGKYDHHYQKVGIPIAHADRIRRADYNWKGLGQVVTIGNDVWIGLGCIILSGVTIGGGSVVAAGSVVTHDVDPYCIYAGVPARKIKDRFESEEDKLKHIELVNTSESLLRFHQPIRY